MKKIIYACTLAATILAIGCKKDWDIPGDGDQSLTRLYLVQASKVNTYSFPVKEKPDTILLSAGFGGVSAPGGNIEVTVKASPEIIDSFNNARRTSYLPLPAGAFEFGAKDGKLVIAAGNTTSAGMPVVLYLKGKIRLDKEYLLPVSIAATNSTVAVNEKLRHAFLVIKPQPVELDAKGWKAVSISSEEPAEGSAERPDNGKAVAMFDGKSNTFWHSKWSGGFAYPPHHLVVDMGATQLLSGLAQLPRQGRASAGGNFKYIRVAVSTNGTDWQDLNGGEPFELANNDDRKYVFFPEAKQCRYFRITLPTSADIWGGQPFTHCAELGGF